MGLHVHTNEVQAHFGGHPVQVSTQGSSDGPPVEVVFNAGERGDGATGCRLVITGDRDQLAKMLSDALHAVWPEASPDASQ